MKKLSILSICMFMVISIFTGCAEQSTKEKQIPSLVGEWKQSNSKSETDYQIATITGNTIEIYHATDNGETKVLYWAGSFIAPTTEEPYTWDSKNDHRKTESSMLGSNDDTKTMTYENGILSYDTSFMGLTTTIKLEVKK